MYDLTAFQRDLLYVLAGQDAPHGLAIKEHVDVYYPGEIHYARLYSNLDALVEKGLITKGQRDRRTNTYELTARAEREIAARRDWENRFLD